MEPPRPVPRGSAVSSIPADDPVLCAWRRPTPKGRFCLVGRVVPSHVALVLGFGGVCKARLPTAYPSRNKTMPASRRRWNWSLPLLLVPLIVGWQQVPSGGRGSSDERLLVVQGGWLFTATTDSVIPNPGILIRDSLIVSMSGFSPEELAQARVIQLGDNDFVLPGFIDLHAHYALDLLGKGRIDDTIAYPAIFLANGVTLTFPAGEVQPYKMRDARVAIDAGERPGPRIFNSGPYFGTARAGWDASALDRDSIHAEVDYWVGQGARGFKAKGIGPDHLQWLIEAAHRHGLTVTGHLDSGFRNSVNPRDAILMGIDRVEHFEGGDAMVPTRSAYASLVEMTPEMPEFQAIIELFKERGVYYNSTRSAYGYYGEREAQVYEYFAPEMEYLTPHARALVEAELPRAVSAQFERIYGVKRELIGEFYRQGGGPWMTLGTDHPSWGEFFSGFGVHRELHALHLSGIPAHDVLKIGTINGARALGVGDQLGTLEVGKLADLVVVSGNPMEDIRNTRRVRTVVKNGRVFDPQALLASVRGRLGPVDGADEAHW
jgi:imidazolonepropionase-like amidohydrolase